MKTNTDAIFVLGTHTGVGKTYVSAQLIEHSQVPCVGLKPIISGWDDKLCAESDTGVLLRAQGVDVNDDNIAAISPWRYTAPLTPMQAAEMVDMPIDMQDVLGFCRAHLKSGKRCLIESAGGLMSPIAPGFTNLEWAQALAIPCILVTGNYLGAMNHTLMAIRVLQQSGVDCLATVICEVSEEVDLIQTKHYISTFTSMPLMLAPQGARLPWPGEYLS